MQLAMMPVHPVEPILSPMVQLEQPMRASVCVLQVILMTRVHVLNVLLIHTKMQLVMVLVLPVLLRLRRIFSLEARMLRIAGVTMDIPVLTVARV
jgi:hypothetical protein